MSAGGSDPGHEDEVLVTMADGRGLTIKGLQPPVRLDDVVEMQAEPVVPVAEQDLNQYYATRYAAGG